jgi:hypothetical protein
VGDAGRFVVAMVDLILFGVRRGHRTRRVVLGRDGDRESGDQHASA